MFFRQNDKLFLLHTPCYVCDVSRQKNDIFLRQEDRNLFFMYALLHLRCILAMFLDRKTREQEIVKIKKSKIYVR